MASLAPTLGPLRWLGGVSRPPAGGSGRGGGPEHLGTGFEPLDRSFPGGGWPLGALTEILSDRQGIGEMRLVIPALAGLTRAGRWVVWVAPPHIPYAPALEARGVALSRVLWIVRPRRSSGASRDHLWAAELALRHPACGAVLVWSGSGPREDRVLRRLQIAAEAGTSWGVLFRATEAARRPSPAAVRLRLDASVAGTVVRMLKCRGRAPLESVMTL